MSKGSRIAVPDPATATDRPSRIKAPWSVHASNWPAAAVVSGGYCGQRLPISGAGRQGDPRFRPPRLGPRPYTISAVNSFRGNFVWVLWLAHQPQFSVATTPLADSTPSDHDSSNAPATARSVYVIAHPAARPLRLAPRFWGEAVAPCDRDLRNKDTAACCCVSGGYCCQQLWFSGPGRLFVSVS